MRENRSPGGFLTLCGAIKWICLLATFIGPLLVPMHSKEEPRLAGWPLFYWYQLMWIPISAILLTTAYLLNRRKNAKPPTR